MRTPLSIALALLLLASAAPAIELAAPGDLSDWTFSTPGTPSDGYYFLDPSALSGPSRDFLLVLDNQGELVWFRDDGNLNDFRPIPHTGGYAWVDGRVSGPRGIDVRDAGWERVALIPADHPTEPSLRMDAHEFLIQPDGTYWTLWWETRTYDMSDIVPGGLENVKVEGHVVQRWSGTLDLLWEWRSLDHLDELPFTARLDTNSLYKPEFEHLHVNSVEVTDDAVYLSSRTMSVVIKVERATGEIAWRLGGGPANDFSFSGDVPPDVPLDFNFQHDARLLEDGNLTVFDNGIAHTPRISYAREYALDETELTAELVWWYRADPPTLGRITGSHRVLEGGNHLIGWGNRYPEIAFSEVTREGELVAQLVFEPDDDVEIAPGTYRVRKSTQFTPAARPYVSSTITEEYLQLACNWFGHEDEVASYDVRGGYAPNALSFVGSTNTGYFYRPAPVYLQPYYYQIVARNAAGEVISPPSNILEVQTVESGLDLTLVTSPEIPEAGGVLVYTLTISNVSGQAFSNVPLFTEVLTPGGAVVGPLLDVQFDILPYNQIVVGNMSQAVPGFAPEGEYEFTATAGYPGLNYSDHFNFSKGRPVGESEPASALDAWATGGSLPAAFRAADDGTEVGSSPTQPDRFGIDAVHPNPVNARTTLTLTLPEAGELEVAVVNLLGREVIRLNEASADAGTRTLTLDASAWASGVYLVRASLAGWPVSVRKLVVVK